MNIKKLLVLYLFMINSLTQTCDFKDKDFKAIATPGILISAIIFTSYIWATSGDSVEQRIHDAEIDLATMPEYEQKFDIAPILGEKESQIQLILKFLNINLNNLNAAYNKKLRTDIETLDKAYKNLWFKSFYGGQEIAATIQKVAQYKTKAQGLLEYLQQHHKYIHGYQIINETTQLSHRNVLQNEDETIKLIQSYNLKSPYPLFNYVKKIQKDLECIEFLITEKKALQDYPQLSKMIIPYQIKLEEIKNAISAMEAYKHEALGKLENDIALLTEKHEKLELLVKKLQLDVQIAKMR